MTVEEALECSDVPKPKYVISSRYSGINSALRDILELETEPTCILSPCNCNDCVEEYYLDSNPRSRYFKENFPSMSHIDINSSDPACVDVFDMAEIGKEAGYLKNILYFPTDNGNAYVLVLTKNKDLYDYFMNLV